jgi:hypothetical protein
MNPGTTLFIVLGLIGLLLYISKAIQPSKKVDVKENFSVVDEDQISNKGRDALAEFKAQADGFGSLFGAFSTPDINILSSKNSEAAAAGGNNMNDMGGPTPGMFADMQGNKSANDNLLFPTMKLPEPLVPTNNEPAAFMGNNVNSSTPAPMASLFNNNVPSSLAPTTALPITGHAPAVVPPPSTQPAPSITPGAPAVSPPVAAPTPQPPQTLSDQQGTTLKKSSGPQAEPFDSSDLLDKNETFSDGKKKIDRSTERHSRNMDEDDSEDEREKNRRHRVKSRRQNRNVKTKVVYVPQKCPQMPDMSLYIRKDAIPCWGCNLK